MSLFSASNNAVSKLDHDHPLVTQQLLEVQRFGIQHGVGPYLNSSCGRYDSFLLTARNLEGREKWLRSCWEARDLEEAESDAKENATLNAIKRRKQDEREATVNMKREQLEKDLNAVGTKDLTVND